MLPALTALLLAAPPTPPAALPCAEPPPAGMACIPGGPFVRGTDTGQKEARPQQSVWLQTFYMDVDEVTNTQYEACVKAKRCDPAGPLYRDFSRPQQPINGLNWFDAVKYCEAHGKRLPTEAQWEKAARGPDGDVYPWGNEPATCERAVIKDERGRSCGVKKRGQHPDNGRTFEIGTRPAGRYGLRDMAGNSYEWVYDWFSPSYADCGEACAGVDPLGPCEGKSPCKGHRQRGVRGGSWYWGADHATGFYRRAYQPNNKPAHHFGFRCAATVEQAAKLPAAVPAAPGK
jgi:sulfatase modifying factor 1